MKKTKNRSVVGLDIGSHTIKCVEVTSESDKIKLVRVSILPAPSTGDGMTKTVKLLLDQDPTLMRHVRISVSGGASLLIRRIQLPTMTAGELKGAIRFEAESHIPFPVDDCQLAFQILDQSEDKKKINVLLVAAKKDFIQERLKALAVANIVPEVIDVDIFCLINAFEILGPDEKEPTYGLLNIGHQVSSFAIIQNKLPYFVREIPFGSKSVTQALQKAKGVSEAEAEALKIQPPADALPDMQGLLREGFEPMLDEMKHSIDFFENESGEGLKTVWLSGGGAMCPGTPQALSEELGRHLALWDNTKKMEIFGDIDQRFLAEHSAELNVALGMALRGSGR